MAGIKSLSVLDFVLIRTCEITWIFTLPCKNGLLLAYTLSSPGGCIAGKFCMKPPLFKCRTPTAMLKIESSSAASMLSLWDWKALCEEEIQTWHYTSTKRCPQYKNDKVFFTLSGVKFQRPSAHAQRVCRVFSFINSSESLHLWSMIFLPSK